MNRDALVEAWKREEQQPFSGWDFSYLEGRMMEEQPPWTYSARAGELMHGAASVIDLDTGGAERFLLLREHWPERVMATENYPPNVRLAAGRLLRLGAHVVDASVTDRDPLPFADDAFDLILNRHSAINAREVARILAHGGTFLTQQIHGLWALELLAAFDAEPQWTDATPERNVPRLRSAGLDIVDAQEWSGRLSFVNVGAVVYYLRAVPWLVPGFSVETHLKYLLALQRRIESGERLEYEARKYLIEVRKGSSYARV